MTKDKLPKSAAELLRRDTSDVSGIAKYQREHKYAIGQQFKAAVDIPCRGLYALESGRENRSNKTIPAGTKLKVDKVYYHRRAVGPFAAVYYFPELVYEGGRVSFRRIYQYMDSIPRYIVKDN